MKQLCALGGGGGSDDSVVTGDDVEMGLTGGASFPPFFYTYILSFQKTIDFLGNGVHETDMLSWGREHERTAARYKEQFLVRAVPLSLPSSFLIEIHHFDVYI
jgi:hypothetical protein